MQHSISKWFMISIIAFFTLFSTSSDQASAKGFPDVDPYTEMGIAVTKLATLGIVNGKPDGRYAPNDFVTRAEAAKIMYGVLELEQFANEVDEVRFPDVPKKHWAYKEIMTMSDWKYVNGYPDGTFKPSTDLTRGQMATILYNTLNLQEGPSTLPFTDVKKSDYYYNGVAALYQSGITKGKSTTKFAPNEKVTRGELALFLDRSNILDDLLLQEETFAITEIEKVNGQLIIEEQFKQILSTYKNDIWSIDLTDFSKDAYYDETTMLFENLTVGETIFDIYFNELDLPIYLKVIVNEDLQTTYQFMTPTYLTDLAKQKSGTKALADKLKQLMVESGIDYDDYYYLYLDIDSGENYTYYSQLSDAIFYFEFTNTEELVIHYDFSTTVFGEITLVPYITNTGFDFKVE